jgi:integrase
MRLAEVGQLRTEDIMRENGTWFFNVNAEHEGQHVKSEAGHRRVPIHAALIMAGLLDFVKKLEPGQLWKSLRPGGLDDKLTHYTTRQFTEYRRSLGIVRPRVNFHSFRRTFITCLDNAGVAQADVAQICGHERGFNFAIYSAGKSLPALQTIVNKAKFPGVKL